MAVDGGKAFQLVAPTVAAAASWVAVIGRNIAAQSANPTGSQAGFLQRRKHGLAGVRTEHRWFTLRHSIISCYDEPTAPKPRWAANLSVDASLRFPPAGLGSSGLEFTLTAGRVRPQGGF